MSQNKSHSSNGTLSRLLLVLLITILLGVAALAVFIACRNETFRTTEPDYEEVRLCVKSLVEAQSSYNVHKTRGKFADGIRELGFVRNRGEVMKEAVWNADLENGGHVPHEGYFFTTFALENGKRAVVLGVPANKKPPYFIALYGELGVSMAKARGTSVYRSFDANAFTDAFLSGNTTTEKVREIISHAERVSAPER